MPGDRATRLRLMPGHDPAWERRLEDALSRLRELRARPGRLAPDAQGEFLRAQEDAEAALNASFRTTAEYRDFHFARARRQLAAEGIEMPLPEIADDATVDEIDDVLDLVWQAIEITNSENF